MKILITGANGLLGQKLVRHLGSENRHTVIATGQGQSRIANPPANMQYAVCNIADEQETRTVFALHNPDVVIHAAAMTNVDECELNPEKCHLVNVEATRFVVKATEAIQAHLIHLSTDFIFDGESGPYTEEAKANPISIYGQAKLDAERIVQQAATPWAIVRTILVFGIAPGLSRSNIILWVKANLEQGKSIQVVTDQFRTPTLAEDLAVGCLLIAEKGETGVFNISGEQLMTPYDMAIATADFFGLDKSLIVKASAATFSQPAKRPPRTGFNISKAKNTLGYAPRSFEEGIKILAGQIEA